MKKLFCFFALFFVFTHTILAFNSTRTLNILNNKINNFEVEENLKVYYNLQNIRNKEKYNDNKYKAFFKKVDDILGKKFENKLSISISEWIGNFDDTRILVGNSDNVFVAKVIKNNGLLSGEGIPDIFSVYTSFDIENIYNIKGDISKYSHIVYEGGYDTSGVLHIEDGNLPIKTGFVYLFVSKGDKNIIVGHRNGYHILKKDFLDTKDAIKSSSKVKEFREAYKDEKNWEGKKIKEEKKHFYKNLYEDLEESEKQLFEDFDSGFVEIEKQKLEKK